MAYWLLTGTPKGDAGNKNKQQQITSDNFMCYVELKPRSRDGDGLGGEEAAGRGLHWLHSGQQEANGIRSGRTAG